MIISNLLLLTHLNYYYPHLAQDNAKENILEYPLDPPLEC